MSAARDRPAAGSAGAQAQVAAAAPRRGSSACSSSSSVSSASSSVGSKLHGIPNKLLLRTTTYTAASAPDWSSSAFSQCLFDRHVRGGTPVVLRALPLWVQHRVFSEAQLAECDAIFPPSEEVAGMPIAQCKARVRPSSDHHRTGCALAIPKTVADALQGGHAHAQVLCEIDLTSSKLTSKALRKGPAWMRSFNLLPRVDPDTQQQDHTQLHASLGTPHSFTPCRTEVYGCDAYTYLVRGEQILFMAPPEARAAFEEMFTSTPEPLHEPSKKHSRVNVSDVSAAHSRKFNEHNIHAVHLRAGDMAYIPAGWLHVIKNLTATISFGAVFLRPWNLHHTFDYLNRLSTESTHTRARWAEQCLINIAGVFELLELHDLDDRQKLEHCCSLLMSETDAARHVARWRAFVEEN